MKIPVGRFSPFLIFTNSIKKFPGIDFFLTMDNGK